ncbi:MAG: hypothetical protein A2275_08220 [Bacteroidetes bacterium RIFOXYA12_FULL_35_11]|nr:MAG: hypothetical protein A2X01_09240 [Bacteroidetes bacterium GWF2_35_48]OFY72516.1 MAG: hypothetical protein A2275_08220 [Bacteroidetes bacterium RIFOXYA12_FULL_35_11]OFY96896.1 MAG: hypothetical protein A2309_04825 [Bacteroidetes bacterium RIFOXYB2_FULL_35_7]OFZ03144.1 MAG: hypothetical protein A2491_20305 [Bacteroidetes bacterium RIFOXYC12_FULL_35_7]HBX50221.1 hypothetical protein [Bacteroidales bacterium]
MYRQVLIPDNSRLVLHLPANMIGKKVEVLAFPIEEEIIKTKSAKKTSRDKEIEEFYRSIIIDTSNFKFNRDEANER